MSGLKYLVIVLLVEVVCSSPHQRYVRNAVSQPSYGSGYGYPYQPSASYGSPFAGSQMYPQQSYPYYPSFPSYPSYNPSYPSYGSYPSAYPSYGSSYPSYGSSYPSYGSSYPSYGSSYPSYGPSYPSTYPSYPSSYPSYPNYPYQPNYPTQPDPFAHIPTEIIDVDENGNYDLGIFKPDVNISSSHNASISGPDNETNPVYTHTKIIESKPISATITRLVGPPSSKPLIDVRYSDPNSQKGSEPLGEAKRDGNGGDSTNDQVPNADDDEKDDNEEEKKDDKEEEKNKDGEGGEKGFSSFFG